MSKKDKQFWAFITVWFTTHVVGMCVMGPRAWPGVWVNAGFVFVFGMWTAALYAFK